MKRIFDILFSLCFLLLGAPLFFIIAAAIKMSSRGPVFYPSRRVGKGGKIISCWKFRTMCEEAEKRLGQFLMSHPDARKEWETFSKLKNDPRVTPLGKFLRKSSLDEIPQFWNVLKGDLSVVGPRPYLVEEVEKYLEGKKEKILSVRPGMTGFWQISGRNLLSFSERMRLEELYVERRSFFLDLVLLFKTIPIVFFTKGAY